MKKLTLKKEIIEYLDAHNLGSLIGGQETTAVCGDSAGTICDFCTGKIKPDLTTYVKTLCRQCDLKPNPPHQSIPLADCESGVNTVFSNCSGCY